MDCCAALGSHAGRLAAAEGEDLEMSCYESCTSFFADCIRAEGLAAKLKLRLCMVRVLVMEF